ncbi:MAG: hypothetical protein NPIRA02_20370 [Nitrospirales bacterium]|nr:MAG: hypothetical protein NPIRA02_20370 [Nitrospirales bacterium]
MSTVKTIEEILQANPNAPTNDEYAKDLARKLFPPRDQRVERELDLSFREGMTSLAASESENVEWCGEFTVGLLEASLTSTLISPEAKTTIQDMMADSMPALEKEKTIGHFHFKWTETSSDSRDNVTEADVDATGAELNTCWDRFTTHFRQPQAALIGGQRIIDVDVFYNPGLHGSTSSHSNRIFLNSLTVVSDDCRRRTTSAHELFHRVEYAYGYVTGTAGQRWWVEALGSWSQEYSYGSVNDYVNRVNAGLNVVDRQLLDRSYDACHYWKYFGEQLEKRSAVIGSEGEALREFLEEYSSNGLDAKAASGTITHNRISRTFDQFFQDWSKANYIKDLENPFVRYEYDEDEHVTTSCSRTYGPYRHVIPTIDETITGNTFSWTSPPQSVNAYATDYLHFPINPGVTQCSIRFEGNPSGGSGQFSTHLIMIKDNRWKVIYNNTHITERTWNLSVNAGQYDRCVLVVNGLATGGQYEVSVNACAAGVWKDMFNFVWTLVQSGSDITGTVKTTACGVYTVTGSLKNDNITLKATGNCCNFEYTGKIEDCQKGSGTWTNDCGGNGSWTMSKTNTNEAFAILEQEEIEMADDPATMRN